MYFGLDILCFIFSWNVFKKCSKAEEYNLNDYICFIFIIFIFIIVMIFHLTSSGTANS